MRLPAICSSWADIPYRLTRECRSRTWFRIAAILKSKTRTQSVRMSSSVVMRSLTLPSLLRRRKRTSARQAPSRMTSSTPTLPTPSTIARKTTVGETRNPLRLPPPLRSRTSPPSSASRAPSSIPKQRSPRSTTSASPASTRSRASTFSATRSSATKWISKPFSSSTSPTRPST